MSFESQVSLYISSKWDEGRRENFTIRGPNIAPILAIGHSRLIGGDSLLHIDCAIEATERATAHGGGFDDVGGLYQRVRWVSFITAVFRL